MKTGTWLVVIVAMALGGCANLRIGRPIDLAAVQTIVPGHTTKDDVLVRFGQPLHIVPSEEGEIFVYRHLQGSQKTQELVVTFNQGTVSTFTHR